MSDRGTIHFAVRLRGATVGPSAYVRSGSITGDEATGLAQLQQLMLAEIEQGREVVIWRVKPR